MSRQPTAWLVAREHGCVHALMHFLADMPSFETKADRIEYVVREAGQGRVVSRPFLRNRRSGKWPQLLLMDFQLIGQDHRAAKKKWYEVWWNSFLLFNNCLARPCLGLLNHVFKHFFIRMNSTAQPAGRNRQYFFDIPASTLRDPVLAAPPVPRSRRALPRVCHTGRGRRPEGQGSKKIFKVYPNFWNQCLKVCLNL